MEKACGQIDEQLGAAYGETGRFGLWVAYGALAVALAALFVYRAATADPLWAVENAAVGAESTHAISD